MAELGFLGPTIASLVNTGLMAPMAAETLMMNSKKMTLDQQNACREALAKALQEMAQTLTQSYKTRLRYLQSAVFPDDNSIANTQWAVQAVRNHDDALASEKIAFARAWAAATAIGKDRKRHKAMLAAYDHSFETLLPLAQDLVALWDQRAASHVWDTHGGEQLGGTNVEDDPTVRRKHAAAAARRRAGLLEEEEPAAEPAVTQQQEQQEQEQQLPAQVSTGYQEQGGSRPWWSRCTSASVFQD